MTHSEGWRLMPKSKRKPIDRGLVARLRREMQQRDKTIQFRVTRTEHERLVEGADDLCVTLSAYIRAILGDNLD